MNPSKKMEIRVGIFVAIGLILFCVIVLILGGNKFMFKQQYQLRVRFEQTQGLDRGSLVTFAGLTIGHIADLKFNPNSTSVELTLDIDREYQNLITTTSMAVVKTQGALGDKYIFVSPGKTEGLTLKDGDLLPSENQEDFLDMLSGKSSEMQNIGEIVHELSELLKNVNAENRSALLMENLAATSKNLKGVTGDPALTRSLHRLENILKKVDQGQGTLGRLINDPTLHEKILDLLGESKRNRYLQPLLQESVRSSSR